VIKDKAVRMTTGRRSRVWADTTDSDAVREIVEAAALTVGSLPDTQPAHRALVQFDATDWDFLLSRADALGLVAVVRDGVLSLKPMALAAAATRTFSFALGGISDMRFEIDAAGQAARVCGLAWDPGALAAADPADAAELSLAQGRIGRAAVGDELRSGPELITHMVAMPAAETQCWASGRMARLRLALIRGRIGVGGLADLEPMEVASLDGFGDRIDGDALITGLRHRLDAQGFATDIQFGLSPEPVGRLADIADMPAAGLLPPLSGLQLGIIASADADPENEARVQVKVPAIAADPPAPLWARIAAPDAGDRHGFCFFPQEGDEVVLGFLADDPRHPVVLGRLHGSRNVPPDGFTDATRKGIVAKSGALIGFSEAAKPSVTVSTPGGHRVVLDDEAGSLTLSDSNGNTVKLSQDGIAIASASDLTLDAKGVIKITGVKIDLN
jgi:uncharacterized protein involved in type VI secretion and phage assembly